MTLPLKYSYAPMEAQSVAELPTGPQWEYEPKWDGFRCIAFRDGAKVELRSKAGKSLSRYFPEIIAALRNIGAKKFVLDGDTRRQVASRNCRPRHRRCTLYSICSSGSAAVC